MHNPYEAKLALLAASFVAVSAISACNSNPQAGDQGGGATSESLTPEISVNPAPPPPEPPEPEISVNPAPPPPPEPV